MMFFPVARNPSRDNKMEIEMNIRHIAGAVYFMGLNAAFSFWSGNPWPTITAVVAVLLAAMIILKSVIALVDASRGE